MAPDLYLVGGSAETGENLHPGQSVGTERETSEAVRE